MLYWKKGILGRWKRTNPYSTSEPIAPGYAFLEIVLGVALPDCGHQSQKLSIF
jgi:hypothetical protein